MILIEIAVFFTLAILGIPVSIALCSAAIIAILSSDFTILTIAQKMITGIDSFTLISVPLFLLAGRLMNDGGITDRIFTLARCFVGRFRGGLAHVNVVASMIFAGMSGSAVAVTYSLILSMFVYKSVTLKDLPRILLDTVCNTAAVMFIVSCSSSFSWVLIIEDAAKLLINGIFAITSNHIFILLMINIMVIVLGCFLENGVVLILVTPLLLPVINALGINVIHFGVFLVLNLMIGVVTPPVGMSLYTVSRVSGVSVEKISRHLFPLLLPLVVVLLMTTYIPGLSLWLASVVMP